jgi:hypothetical protein
MNIQYRRPDGSFVGTVNGLPYHITPDDPLFALAGAMADELGDSLLFEPAPPAPSEAEILAARRAAATIDRGPLCKALLGMEMLTADSAIAGARGELPAEWRPYLAALPEAQRVQAQIDWGDPTQIRYSNPLLQKLACAYASSQMPEGTEPTAVQAAATDMLDQLFGISQP